MERNTDIMLLFLFLIFFIVAGLGLTSIFDSIRETEKNIQEIKTEQAEIKKEINFLKKEMAVYNAITNDEGEW